MIMNRARLVFSDASVSYIYQHFLKSDKEIDWVYIKGTEEGAHYNQSHKIIPAGA